MSTFSSTSAHRLDARIVGWLNDAVMGFLALAAAELALAEAFFSLAPGLVRLVESLQWCVIGLFALEYSVHLAAAQDRKRFLLDPWRMVDLLIIAVPLISLVPTVTNALRSTPILRLFRLVRLASFAARAGGAVARDSEAVDSAPASALPEVRLCPNEESSRAQTMSWKEFRLWAAHPEGSWCHISRITPAQFDDLAATGTLSRSLLDSCLSASNYPRLENSRSSLILSVWLPSAPPNECIEPERAALLLVARPSSLLTIAPDATDWPAALQETLRSEPLARIPFIPRVPLALLNLVLDRNEKVAGHLEQHLRALEDVSVRDSKPSFFEHAFRLRKELSAAKSDLWRVKGILASLADGRVRLPGDPNCDGREPVRSLQDRADYLYETVDNLREGLLSVLELHLNVVSFEMNKFMRLLAVVSVLGLIPSVVGGLLGMNLNGNPWPATLSEVTFGVGSTMLLLLYLFVARGWLR